VLVDPNRAPGVTLQVAVVLPPGHRNFFSYAGTFHYAVRRNSRTSSSNRWNSGSCATQIVRYASTKGSQFTESRSARIGFFVQRYSIKSSKLPIALSSSSCVTIVPCCGATGTVATIGAAEQCRPRNNVVGLPHSAIPCE
jgi:hypothetical protein